MKNVILKSVTMRNFKGVSDLTVEFSDKENTVKGANATGKTTMLDGVTWLMFGRDSLGQTNFAIRPLDESGNMIDHIDIVVSAVFNIDGEDHELKKIQKQKWVKKRGETEQKFSGNVNSFEIDGYPKKESDFKDFVNSIIKEDVFSLLTDPMCFTRLPWKEQRKILMRFITGKTDAELAEGKEEYAIILPELKVASTDDIQKKYSMQKSELRKKIIEYPVRIDELQGSKVNYNTDGLNGMKEAIEEILAEIDQKIADEKNGSDNSILKDRLESAKTDASVIYAKAKRELIEKKSQLDLELGNINAQSSESRRQLDNIKATKTFRKEKLQMLEEQRKKLADEYKDIQGKQFDYSLWRYDESGEYCKMCGQKLPTGKIEELKADFEKRKAKAVNDFENGKKTLLEKITEKGMALKQEIEDLKSCKKPDEETVKSIKNSLEDLTIRMASITGEIEALPEEPDLSGNEEYQKLQGEIENIEKQIADKETDETGLLKLEDDRQKYINELDSLKGKIALIENNKVIDARIAELRAEHRETDQKLSNVERILDTLDAFIRYKMNVISEQINSQFKTVRFKLFDNQINGGLKECCEATVGGVPFSTLNNGHRIIAGLEIIQSLQQLYVVKCFVFTDNAEAISDGNFPDMDCQTIRLCVTDDKELVVN